MATAKDIKRIKKQTAARRRAGDEHVYTDDEIDAANLDLPPDADAKPKSKKLSKLKGQVVVVNFWATWCRPCMQELPYLNAFHKKYGTKGLTVLAVATDGPETAAQVRNVAKRKKWKMPVIHDASGKLVAQLNPRGNNPFTVFIDKQGRIAKAHEGYNSGDEKKYHAIIKNLLKESAKG